MNSKQESPQDAQRSGEECALRRAEQRARETAAKTGTPLVIYRDGKVKELAVTESEDEADPHSERT